MNKIGRISKNVLLLSLTLLLLAVSVIALPTSRTFAAGVTEETCEAENSGGVWKVEYLGGGQPTYSCECPAGKALDSNGYCNTGDFKVNPAGDCVATSGDCISNDIQLAINVLSVVVGIVILGMVVFGGIRYSLSRSNPQEVQAAKGHLTNAIIALIAYVFIYTLLQWIVPGGIF
jgi:hypothetical protein